ncbi:MAG: MFS transporter [Myxococcales bacterium]|nr:MFS transporter [Myxococcales bacterium]
MSSRPLVLATSALFVVSLGYGVIVPILPELAGGRDATDEGLLSAVYAGYAAAKIAMQIPGGVWVDRSGAERIARLALALFTVSLAGFLLPVGLVGFTVVRALEGAATGLAYPAAFALAARGPAEGAGKRLGLVAGLGTSGLLAGPALAGALAEISPRLPVAIATGVGALVTLALFALPSAPRAEPAPDAPRTAKDAYVRLGRLALDVGFLLLMLPIAFNKLTFSAFQGLFPLAGPDLHGLETTGVTALFALTGVVFGASQPLGGWLSDRFAPRRVVLVASVPLLAALLALAYVPDATGFFVAYGSYVAASSIVFAATTKHAATSFGTDDTFGGLFGLLSTLTDVATIVGPLLFLNLYASSAAGVFVWMAAIGVPCALAYAFARR